jgi:hypothetical protein
VLKKASAATERGRFNHLREGLARPNTQAPNKTDVPILAIKKYSRVYDEKFSILHAHFLRKAVRGD